MTRPQAPDCLQALAPVWIAAFVEARQRQPAATFSWPSRECYGEIRRSLVTMSVGHCAFCDGLIGLTSRETVEHFRPKSVFPALAYDWDNLFPCCDLCQSVKRERFDAALLRPDRQEYRFEDFFVLDYRTGLLRPRPGADDAARYRAEVTIDLYGLNRPERARERLRTWRHFCQEEAPCLDDFPYRYALIGPDPVTVA